jgi:hypothetical protein
MGRDARAGKLFSRRWARVHLRHLVRVYEGSCRCAACREAVAVYRASRRSEGLDRPPVAVPAPYSSCGPNYSTAVEGA